MAIQIRDPSEPSGSGRGANVSRRVALGLGLALIILVLYDNALAGDSNAIQQDVRPRPASEVSHAAAVRQQDAVPPPTTRIADTATVNEAVTEASSVAVDDAAGSNSDDVAEKKVVPTPSRTPKASSDGDCDAYGVCKPMVLRSGSLFVGLTPDAVREPELYRIAAMKKGPEGQPLFSFSPEVRHMIIDIGTNMDPDTVTDFWDNRSIGMLWFEPQKTLLTHPMHLPKTRAVVGMEHARVAGIPAAIAPTNGMTKLYVSATHGCTSLLPMNQKSLEDSSWMKNSFRGGDGTFRDWSTSKIGFINCIKKGKDREFDWVPTIRGTDILRFVEPDVNILYISVDAQGFDMQVTASFGKLAARADMIMLECQDLPHGHGMFLTQGAFSCAEVRHCIESQLPHRMVAGGTGEIADTCTINNPSEERNCMFRRMDRPYFRRDRLPYLVRRDKYKLRYGIREDLKCPSFDHG